MTMVYRYGITAPREGADVVREQMRLAHAYRRNLVLIERGRRWAERQARSAASEELAAAEAAVAGTAAACEWLAAEIRQDRKATRSRSETASARLQIATARAAGKAARDQLYAVRERFAAQCRDCRKAKSEQSPCPHASAEARALRDTIDVIDERANELAKNARHHSGVWWGSYLLVERAHRASCAAPLYERDGVTPHDPELPRPWDGGGVVGVQIQSTHPLTVEGALAQTDSRLRVGAPPWPEEWLARATLAPRPPRRPDSVVGTGRGRLPPGTLPGRDGDRPAPTTRPDGTPARWVRDRAARHGELRLRVGTAADGSPVWAGFRLDYHRPLPAGASVRWATVHRRARGPHGEWSLCVTVDPPGGAEGAEEGAAAAAADRPTVAVDVGWRLMDGAIRVAAWRDSLGRSGELQLSVADVRVLRVHEEVRSERDRAFDVCKIHLKQWIAASPVAPEWMREAARTMHAWRKSSRMVRLLRRWERERPERGAAEDAALEAVRAWATGDWARWATEEACRARGLRRRRDKYRCFAAQLTRAYATIVVEHFDLRAVAARRPTGDDGAENEVARGNRQLASVSELRDCLINAAPRHRSQVVAVDAADTTRTCPACGLVADRDAAARVRLRCACGHEWDQDREGAAPLLLERWRERPGDARVLAGAREPGNSAESRQKKGEKWARARRMGAAKKARIRERSKVGQ
jgi:hypothetical protein